MDIGLARKLLVSALTCGVLLAQSAVAAHEMPVTLSARADAGAVGRTNGRLIGVGWDGARFTARKMSALRPRLARIDAGIERLYPRGPKVDGAAFAALAREVRAARSIGAEPAVILGYTPEWLADGRPASDKTKVPPSDADAYRRLVEDVVSRLSSFGVRFFEVWNEPNFPVFYQGLLVEFLERVFRPSAEAVTAVAERTGRRLRFGGCACLEPDPSWMIPMMEYAERNALPLDFLSWHHYGNVPFIGPDGTEPLGPPEFRPALAVLGQRNPHTSPVAFADQVELVRSWRDAIWSNEPKPELWIDEWNLSSGGFDRRHDTTEGAAFQAGVLIELQRSGLDRASIFRSVDPAYGPDVVPADPEFYGGWGLVGRRGTAKPAWRVHRFWGQLGPQVLAFGSPRDARMGVSVILTRRNGCCLVALASSFQASASHGHGVELRLEGLRRGRWSVRIEGADGSERRATATVSRGELLVPVDLEPQSAALIEVRPVG